MALMQQHKYLEEIIDREDVVQNWFPGDKREECWHKQQAEYGFDDRETWSLDATFFQWLYERLRMFKDIGGEVVDFNFYKFDVDGSKLTQLEIIDKMISNCEQIIKIKSDDIGGETAILEQETARLWSIVIPAMWW